MVLKYFGQLDRNKKNWSVLSLVGENNFINKDVAFQGSGKNSSLQQSYSHALLRQCFGEYFKRSAFANLIGLIVHWTDTKSSKRWNELMLLSFQADDSIMVQFDCIWMGNDGHFCQKFAKKWKTFFVFLLTWKELHLAWPLSKRGLQKQCWLVIQIRHMFLFKLTNEKNNVEECLKIQ